MTPCRPFFFFCFFSFLLFPLNLIWRSEINHHFPFSPFNTESSFFLSHVCVCARVCRCACPSGLWQSDRYFFLSFFFFLLLLLPIPLSPSLPISMQTRLSSETNTSDPSVTKKPKFHQEEETHHKMVSIPLRVKKLSEAATLPARGSKSAAGYDLFR